jgi:5-methylcytosine-specific restriction endonuclease McrA
MEVERNCEFCGKPFTAHRRDSRFCSLSCADKWHYRKNHISVPVPDTVFTCVVCGKEFKAKSNRSVWRLKYCSPECRQVPNSIYKRESYVPKPPRKTPDARICDGCGKEFSPDVLHPDSKTCSAECYRKVYQAKQKAIRDAKREELFAKGRDCPICGKHFIPSTHNNIYCSPKCRRKHITITAKQNETPEIIERKRESNFKKRWQGNYCKALARDNKTCQICGATESIEVHHINGMGEYRKMNGERILVRKADHSLKNLITLCPMCHRGLHNNLLVKHKDKWYIKGSLFEQLGITGPIEIWTGK